MNLHHPLFQVDNFVFYQITFPHILAYILYIMFFLLIIILLILHDYKKPPIDKIYFRNPIRLLMGIQNSIIDVLYYRPIYSINNFENLHLLHDNINIIKNEYQYKSPTLVRNFFHDKDIWFDKNDNYYYFKCTDFPATSYILSQIPSIVEDSAIFAVMVGEHILPPHKADMNYYLRYQLTIVNNSNDGDSWMQTEQGIYNHDVGEFILFDHSRIHSVKKTTSGTRVVLIADIKRF